jgi:N,N'-diacetylchitobiose transport system permease protein
VRLSSGSTRFENRVLPWLLVAPAAVVVFGLVLYPLARTVWLSFRAAGLSFLVSGRSRFVGLDNYADLVGDPHLRRVLLTTIGFGLACVAATLAVGLAVALLLDQRFRGRALLAVLVLLPWAVPRVAAGTVWRWLFDDQFGLINWALPGFDGHAWFNSRGWAFLAVGVVVVWQAFPFVALALLAGLQAIPPEVKEAARVDGAGPWHQLFYVTLPLLRPLLLTLVVVETIWDFKVFDQVFVMTNGGGPARSTEVAAITVYRAIARRQLGSAAAMAVALFLVLLALTLVYTRLAREEVRA